jgi:hypothetical protein
MKSHSKPAVTLLLLSTCAVISLCAGAALAQRSRRPCGPPPARQRSTDGTVRGERRLPVVFTGGYETDPRDHGRPVALIAGALGVQAEVFRTAFSGVTPARQGERPEPGQVRRNKEALLRVLGPYGVTNERLDAVSDYYRYRPGSGEWWPTAPAAAYATVRNGVVTGVTVTSGGSGYSSAPVASVVGLEGVRLRVRLGFGQSLERNGSVVAITIER